MRKMLLIAFLLMMTVVYGCSSAKYISPDAVSKVEGTGIESRDMRTVANEMATDLLSSRAIADFRGVPTIAVLPLKNRTRFIIDQDIITSLMTNTLINNGAGRVAVLNREILDNIQKEREMKSSGQFSGTDEGKIAGADFFLQGSIRSLTASDGKNVSDYVVFRFELTNANSSVTVWSKDYQMKKEGTWGVQYQ